eukprot:379481-Lingulodinium_polyedra.AAC.1
MDRARPAAGLSSWRTTGILSFLMPNFPTRTASYSNCTATVAGAATRAMWAQPMDTGPSRS